MPARFLRRIGWAALLAVSAAVLFALSLHVNAVKSEVRRTEMRILALKQEKLYLETEFETRANQQQLERWNDVDFGYLAPGPGQYFENERELAVLGKPAGPEAPEPIRYAVAAGAPAGLPSVLAPSDDKAAARATDHPRPAAAPVDRATAAATLGQRLVRVDSVPPAASAGRERIKADAGQ